MCKSLLPDELIKRVNPNFLVDNKDPGNNDDDYSNDEDKFDGELPIWIKLHETFVNSLFIQNEKYILCCLPQFCFEVGNKKWFLVLIALFRKLLGYIFNEKSSKMFPKIVLGIKVKGVGFIAGVRQLTTEFTCTVLQTKLIPYTVPNK